MMCFKILALKKNEVKAIDANLIFETTHGDSQYLQKVEDFEAWNNYIFKVFLNCIMSLFMLK